jgi:ATP-dependent RNA helicase DeaD
VAPAGLRRATSLLQRARVQFRVEPIPTAATIRAAQDERWLGELTADDEREVPERVQKQVQRIVESGLSERALAQLIISVGRAIGEPRDVTPLSAEPQRGMRPQDRRPERLPESRGPRQFESRGARPEPRFERPEPRFERPEPRFERPESGDRDARSERPGADAGSWVPFQVSWGETHGADARRLVAMLCRRGNIRGGDIGAIRVSRNSSTVEVAASVAAQFEQATREPDPRDPHVQVEPLNASGAASQAPHESAPRAPRDFAPRAPRDFAGKASRDFAPRAPRDFAPRAPRDFAAKPPGDFAPRTAPRPFAAKPPGDFAGKAPRDFRGKAPRDFAGKAPGDFAPRAPRDFAAKAPRDFAPRAPRDFAAKAPRDFAAKAPRDFAPKEAARDVPPKRPSRKIVVSAPPRRVPKKK